MTFLEEIGGKACVERVHKIFYTKLMTHPWMKGFFVDKVREVLEAQQTDFMVDLFGANPKTYFGKFPMPAHQHLYITEEIFQLRQDLLAESLRQSKVSEAHIERWLAFDATMKKAVVKESLDECEKRFNTDEIIAVPKPG